MGSDHVIVPFLAELAGLQGTLVTRPPGLQLVGDDLAGWSRALATFKRVTGDVDLLKARMLYSGGRPSPKVVSSVLNAGGNTRSIKNSRDWLLAFASRRPVLPFDPLQTLNVLPDFAPAGNGEEFLPPIPGARVAVFFLGGWKLGTSETGDRGLFVVVGGVVVLLRIANYLPDAGTEGVPHRLDLVACSGAWTRVVEDEEEPGPQVWPQNTVGATGGHGFSALERVVVTRGAVAYFGIVYGSESNKVVAKVYDGTPTPRTFRSPAKDVARAPYALSGGLPPPPRKAPDARRHVYLTRRDLDGEFRPVDTDSIIDAWNALSEPSTPGAQRPDTRTIGFDMLDFLADPAVRRERKAAWENQGGSSASCAVRPVPVGRKLEVAHEMKKWLGRDVGHVFGMANSARKFSLWKGVVSGVFINEHGDVCFVLRFMQTGAVTKNYNVLASRFELDTRTHDVDEECGTFVNTGEEIGGSHSDKWGFDTNVSERFAEGCVARVFSDPAFFAAVSSVSRSSVTLVFGEHYSLLHGSSTRVFTVAEAKSHGVSILEDPEEWQLVPSNLEVHNQLLAMKYADSKDMFKRGWLQRQDGKDYVSFFKGKDATHGTRCASLWLCHCALARLSSRIRPTLMEDTSLSEEDVVSRMKDAVNHATTVVPPFVLATIGRVDDAAQSDDEDDDGSDEETVSVGLPDGWTFGWSAMRSAPQRVCNQAVSAPFKALWTVCKVTERDIVASDVNTESDLEMKRALFFRKWKSDSKDTLYNVASSSLLNRAQLSSLYSTIGTRGHLRLAALALIGAPGLAGEPLPGKVWLEEYDRSNVFFAPLAAERIGHPYSNDGEKTFASREWFEFIAGEDTAINYEKFTRFAASHFVCSGTDARNILAEAVSRLTGEEHTCKIVGIELPVYNPFCLFSSGKNKAFSFFQTQADFIARVEPRRPAVGAGEVVIGEYKFLMETRNPTSRVFSWRNVSQVLTNARLFTAMTGITPTYGALIYFTRRETATSYVILFPLRGSATPPDYTQDNAAFGSKLRSFHDGVLGSSILWPRKEESTCVYADPLFMASFDRGFWTTASAREEDAPLAKTRKKHGRLAVWGKAGAGGPKNSKASFLGLARVKEDDFTLLKRGPTASLVGAPPFLFVGAGPASLKTRDFPFGDPHKVLRKKLSEEILRRAGSRTEKRDLERSVNDRVRLAFTADIASHAPIQPGSSITGRDATEQFVHTSQRRWWSAEALQVALDFLA